MSRKSKPDKKLRRVFVERYYIAVEWFDVMSDSPGDAKRKAVSAANKLHPDPRLAATDNGWQADPETPTEVERPGQFGTDGTEAHEMVELLPGVFGAKK